MKTQIETLRKMQVIELEAGFPNGELYNELEDKINAIEAKADKERRQGNVSTWDNQLK
jgi:hypothetical protein